MYLQFLVFIVFVQFNNCWIIEPGPEVIATQGEIWPKPQKEEKLNYFYTLETSNFEINNVPADCEILTEAVTRYLNLISQLTNIAKSSDVEDEEDRVSDSHYVGKLSYLKIKSSVECTGAELPELNMDESYNLKIPKSLKDEAVLEAKTVWGILRGLESFSQLLYIYEGDENLYLNATTIKDYPRYSHRGLLLDTSRHYFPVELIYEQLDAMAYNKMNVFHWHIVDDQSFPYQSALFPELSEKGAYNPKRYIYSQDDIKNIIKYATLRGIRVIPEFDTPGHARSWGQSMPGLLSECYKNKKFTGQYGTINPSKEAVYTFFNDFFNEVSELFPDNYMHIGGDEAVYDCWKDNEEITKFMNDKNIKDYKSLQTYYMGRILNVTNSKDIKPIVWEEVYLSGTNLPSDAIVEFWLRDSDMKNAVNARQKVILSSCWYLDHLDKKTSDFYKCDPQNYLSKNKDSDLLLGGEACMWSEHVNPSNVISRTWPRASATAEKLWSKHEADNYETAKHRLEEHACRMNRRNIDAEPPNGPGYCLL